MSSLRPYVDNTSFCASPEAVFVSSAEAVVSEPAAWLPAAVVSVVDAPPQAVSIIAAQSTTAAVFFMIFFSSFSLFEIIFLRVDRISARAMVH